MYRSRKALLSSFIIFAIAISIGVISSRHNPDFLAVIVGDGYVEMTKGNINKGDPMAVYKGGEQSDMFFYITFNNIRVSFFCFILGIFGSLGTYFFLLYNGVMLGAFQYFFYSKGLFWESFLTIWIHGTIEISAIIIAGAAGIVLGNGVLFPKTYDRGTSLQIAGLRGARIIFGIIPLFVIAGFLESFVTRLTGMPTILKVLIILFSLALIIGVYVIYPWWYYHRSQRSTEEWQIVPTAISKQEIPKVRKRSYGNVLAVGITLFRNSISKYAGAGLRNAMLVITVGMVLYQLYISDVYAYPTVSEYLLSSTYGGVTMFVLYWLVTTYVVMICGMIYQNRSLRAYDILAQTKYSFIPIALMTLPALVAFYFGTWWLGLLVVLVLPPHLIILWADVSVKRGYKAFSEIQRVFSEAYASYFPSLGIIITIGSVILLFLTLMVTGVGDLFTDFISWHDVFTGINVSQTLYNTLLSLALAYLLMPLLYFLCMTQHYSTQAHRTAIDLFDRYEDFNTDKTIFEK